jgi:periplasmic divalent cation tolerance protein
MNDLPASTLQRFNASTGVSPQRLLPSRKCLPLSSMRSAASFAMVLVTAPDLRSARALAGAALAARLVACVNLVPRIESHYWWKGKIESGTEVLLVLKTRRSHLATLEKVILKEHPYNTPEFLVISLTSGTRRYLEWLAASTRR